MDLEKEVTQKTIDDLIDALNDIAEKCIDHPLYISGISYDELIEDQTIGGDEAFVTELAFIAINAIAKATGETK